MEFKFGKIIMNFINVNHNIKWQQNMVIMLWIIGNYQIELHFKNDKR